MTSGPKIVYIETRYVQTDATHFRDVVQHLTGKNSSTTNSEGNINGASFSFAGHNKTGIFANDDAVMISAKPQEDTTNATTDDKNTSFTSSMPLMNVSFKDFEALFSDLPSMEELLML